MKPQPATEKSVAPRKPVTARQESLEVFRYPVDSSPNPALDESSEWSIFGGSQAQSRSDGSSNAEFEERLAEETRRAFEEGRERGRQMEREAQRESLESMAAALKAAQENQVRQMAGLAESFAAARDRYLHEVEHEVVKLTLAIAARILRREAQMDPLLLTGAARVALGQLAATTEVKLRVPAAEANLWTEAMALLPNLPLRPTVVAVDSMRLGDCFIETSLGTVDLGIRAQLAEIERGFFDRAGATAAMPTLDVPEQPADRVANRSIGQPERRL